MISVSGLVSVVIPCYNEEKYIKHCVSALLKGSYQNIEIIVVDGGSTDTTSSVLQALQHDDNRVILLHNEKRITPVSLNKGIKHSRGDFVAILGAHAEPACDWISKNIECLNKHPEALVCGGLLDTENEGIFGQAISIALSSRLGVGQVNFRIGGKPGPVDTVVFGCYRKETFTKHGYFDELLATNQDDEYNLRLFSNNETLYFDPSISCKYFSRSSLIKLIRQYWRYGFYKFAVLFKNQKIGGIRQLVPATAIAAFIVLLILSVFSLYPAIILLFLICIYMILIIFFTVSRIFNNLSSAILLPIIIPIIHVCYGTGFLLGIPWYFYRKSDRNEKNK